MLVDSEKKLQCQAMDLDEYLGLAGCDSWVDNFMIDKLKLPHGETLCQKQKRERQAYQNSVTYHEYRSKCIKEYNNKVDRGELRPLTSIERWLRTARGHEDLQATHAARRLLAKCGINWRTGKVLEGETI